MLGKLPNLLAVGSKTKSDGAQIKDPRTCFPRLLRLAIVLPALESLFVLVDCRALLTPRPWTTKLYSKSGASILGPTGTVCRDGAPARWTHLLSLKPALKAAEVQDVTAWQLLWTHSIDCAGIVGGVPRPHFLAADNARVFLSEILGSCVGVSSHLLNGSSVAQQGVQSLDKVSRRHEQISHDVYGQPVEHEQHKEEGDVDAEFDHVWF